MMVDIWQILKREGTAPSEEVINCHWGQDGDSITNSSINVLSHPSRAHGEIQLETNVYSHHSYKILTWNSRVQSFLSPIEPKSFFRQSVFTSRTG